MMILTFCTALAYIVIVYSAPRPHGHALVFWVDPSKVPLVLVGASSLAGTFFGFAAGILGTVRGFVFGGIHLIIVLMVPSLFVRY